MYQIMPWLYTPELAIAFENETSPQDILGAAAGGLAVPLTNLSYRSTDIGYYLPLIQQKTLATGIAAGSLPYMVRVGSG